MTEENGEEIPSIASVTGNSTTYSANESGIGTIVYKAYNRKITGEYKLRLVKDDNKSGRLLLGAKFNISINGGLAKEYTTDDNGEINIAKIMMTDQGEDIIEIEETKPPVGYKANTEKVTLKVTKEVLNDIRYIATNVTGNDRAQLIQQSDRNNIVLLRVGNERSDDSYNLRIVKIDNDNPNKKLENAKFKVTFYNQSKNEPEVDIVEEALEYTTNSKGEIVISRGIIGENLTGKIKIEEIEAPAGYDIGNNSTINLTFTTGALENKLLVNEVRDEIGNAKLAFDRGTQLIEVSVNNKVQKFDLALRQFITKINDRELETSREPKVDSQEVANLANGRATYDSGTTALKPHNKEPLTVKAGDKIIYTIRVYNEGKASGYAKGITEYLPQGLELVPQSESATNTKYGWLEKASNRVVSTNYLRNTVIQGINSTKLSYKDVQIECRVTRRFSQEDAHLKNVAELTQAEDVNGNEEDIDSEVDSLSDSQKNSYQARTSARGRGYEDDDDYEEVVMPKENFDLALRKFITSVNKISVESREPSVSEQEKERIYNKEATFDDGTTAQKTQKKSPVLVRRNDKVIYTIRIYNEGKVDGYAKEIADYLPEGLELVPSSQSEINNKYGWTKSENGKVITTYLQNELIQGISQGVINYKDVQIECEVTKRAEGENTTIKSIAEITRAEDIDGNTNDIDSVINNLTLDKINQYNVETSTRGKGYEDDDDYEEISISKEYFDLALRKFIVQINNQNVESREPTITAEEIKKLSIQSSTFDEGTTALKQHRKTPLAVEKEDRVIYTIRVYNEGNINGYVKEITEYLPEGLELVAEAESTINSQYGWKVDSNNNRKLTTNYLQNDLIEGAESAELKYKDIQIECRVTKDSEEKDILLKSVSEITNAEDIDGKSSDVDSSINNLTDNQKNQYSPENSEKGKGYEDDDDYEQLIIKRKYFDLALRKFVTKVNNTVLSNREPQVSSEETGKICTSEATYDNGTTAEKVSIKTPIAVETGDKIVYTIRVYNEGNTNGYAKEITEYLPEGIELVSSSESTINTQYRWSVDSNNNRKVTTNYLQNELINSATSTSISYKDIQIECKITKKPEEQNISLVSIAEITRAENVDGNTKDIDSMPKSLTEEQRDSYNPEPKTKGKGYEDDDDYEEVVLLRKYFDLSLRKFATKVNNTKITNREPQITSEEINKLSIEEATFDNGTTALKTSTKTPIVVETGDKVVYTIRVYNEGNINGYAKEITEYLPEGIELVSSSESTINTQYRWNVDSNNNRKVTTDYLQNELINSVTSTSISYKDIQIECKITKKPEEQNISLKNITEITRLEDINGNTKDIDSTPNNIADGQKNNYNPETKEQGKGYEDDDDYEEVVLLRKYFDLSLRKFITKVNNTSITNREPQITSEEINKLSKEEATFDNGTTALKTSTKTPIVVETGDKVVYTIRVYNEGSINGYAKEITEYLPEGMELVQSSESAINIKYRWNVDSNNNRRVTTDYLKNELINSVTSTSISYKDVQIECKITKKPEEKNISFKNVSEITRAEDVYGNVRDIDSETNDLTDNQKNQYNIETSQRGRGYQDDDDYEEVVMLRKYFDLSLRKFITKVNNTSITNREPQISSEEVNKLSKEEATFDNGTTVEKIHTKKSIAIETGDKIVYTIRIYNEGSINGYAKEITEYLPEGLELVPSSESTINNKYRWALDSEDSKKVRTTYLQEQLIESTSASRISYKDIQIECKVTKEVEEQRVSLKSVAEITKVEDIYGNIKDIDSVPDNLTNEQKCEYKTETSDRGKGYEDDDDYEEVIIRGKYFDLSLRKFITKINNKEVESREPKITQQEALNLIEENAMLDNGTTALKIHSKTPLTVEKGDKVTYTVRVYNEGSINGYAKEITEYLPEGLELVPISESTINSKYKWNADSSDKRKITTTYLQDELIESLTTTKFDFKDIEVECKVIKEAEEKNVFLKSITEITNIEDINGNTKDTDSLANNLTDNQKNQYKPEKSEQGKGYEDDDDYEELVIKGRYFDLALRQFVTGINDNNVENREPTVDIQPLLKGETTANYNHTKEPLEIEKGNKVTYTIRVYNEGTVNGYVVKMIEHLPPELEYLPDDTINIEYGWKQKDDRTLETEYLKNTLIKAFDMEGDKLDYKDIKIKCRVKENSPYLKQITNIAEIKESRNNLDIPDRDNKNKVKVPSDNDLQNYKKEELGREYIAGQEDDDDFEKIILKKFDLALRKFITNINNQEISDRIPEVDTSKYGEIGTQGQVITNFTYNHSKEPVKVSNNDIVVYTIRVYNEGTKSGYAKEIKDTISEGLIFIPENEINKHYGWKMYDEDGNETNEISKAINVKSNYLSKENNTNKGVNLLKEYNKETMKEADYKDVKVAFKVSIPNTPDRIIVNKAEISEDSDENGNEVLDIDSNPEEWKEEEDDQDIEKIYVQYFDLSLRKWVNQVVVIEDGIEKVKDTGHYAEQEPEPVVKVDLNQKRIDNTVIKFKYSIRIANEGEISGYAEEISDYIPNGLIFNQADNPLWKEADGKITTDQLKNKLLNPGETKAVEVILTWVNGGENMGNVMKNIAEISKDKNESNTPDIDSTPNNQKEGEDDIDDAPVALTMVTGKAPTYIAISSGILAVIAGGVFLIKKYVV